MALAVTYTNFGGQLVSEDRGGTKRDYVSDTLGSTIAMMDSSGDVTDTWEYWPYGEVSSHTGDSETPFTFVGTLGYFKNLVSSLTYVRARFYQAFAGQWMTVDSMWPAEDSYMYAFNSPVAHVDPSGTGPWKCEKCAYALAALYWNHEIHWCCHKFVHCLICCVLNHEFDKDCAIKMQDEQGTKSEDPRIRESRMAACKAGIEGNVATADCAEHCKKKFPICSSNKNCKNPPKSPYWPYGGHLPLACYNCSPFLKWHTPWF